ncbi:LPS-assembly lipoprotein LptE [Thiolapillus brandeum]|uniref:LPS-assembly lipoprotein LptE n=1 Tax=Thiolapillus brandeum TaxID=1076588 RepID=A0A7U6JIK6_9GAMM|nr:LPS assembly lipoprotein LptE [Thiolapillus brandeum]BAO45639.1 LPS-assembly lipoprotein [Thiolapillus brandeum]
MMNSRNKKGFFVLALTLFLGACGFHPRGGNGVDASGAGPVFIVGLAPGNLFVRELRHQLQLVDVAVTDDSSEAATVLRLGEIDRKRAVFSVNANNKVVEYEIRLRLPFRIEHPPGRKAEEQYLERRYLAYDPGGQLLGRTREARLRQNDAYREMARQLIQRLARAGGQ